jgi:N-acetylmuramoyl-L-alanine amidase
VQKLLIAVFFLSHCAFAQSVADCKKRFDTYLNFRGSLNGYVQFDEEGIYLLDANGKKELAIYAAELPVLADFFANSSIQQQEKLINEKKLTRYSRRKRDSLLIAIDDKTPPKQKKGEPLQGYRIAIDPGHFSTNLTDARIEQKYLYFLRDSIKDPIDTVKLFESVLTFNTATHLKTMLESRGAEVFLTRYQNNHTSFDCTYPDWIKYHKQKSLDSLKNNKLITPERYTQLMKYTDYKLFWDFFRDYDLANRARKINNFNPHLTVVIHFNVDEANVPWRKTTEKNFTMAFIGGAVTLDNFKKTEGKLNFLRLLLTDQLNQSEKLAGATVSRFNRDLKIPIASQFDAVYLKDNCTLTGSPGVFARNLILCRKINSPLVYGESLYQDNVQESLLLMQGNHDVYGVKSSIRLAAVAKSYYQGILDFIESGGLK